MFLAFLESSQQFLSQVAIYWGIRQGKDKEKKYSLNFKAKKGLKWVYFKVNSVTLLYRKLRPGQVKSPAHTRSLSHLFNECIKIESLPYAGCEDLSQPRRQIPVALQSENQQRQRSHWGWNVDLPPVACPGSSGELKSLKTKEYGGLYDVP